MRAKLVLALVLLSIIAAPAAGQQGARDAQLEIRQQAFVGSSVDQDQVDGQVRYSVRGEQVRIVPTNFNATEVIDFGVDTSSGQLSYDADFNEFVFDPQGANGTFEVYWIVPETTSYVQNNTTFFRQSQVRYSALIRVTGLASVEHITEARNEEQQRLLELGRVTDDAIDDIRDLTLPFARDEGTNEEILQAMVVRYVNTGDPIAALTGRYTEIAFLLVFTLGGLIWIAQSLGLFAWMVRSLRGRLNRFEIMESEEGDLATRQAQLDEMERKRTLNNTDYNEIFENDHVAYAFREVFGETPHDGFHALVNTQILPEVWVTERLLAMGQCGWTVRPEFSNGNGLVEASLVSPDSPKEDEDIPIKDALDEGLLSVIDWDDSSIRDFNLVDADFDPAEFDQTPTTLSLGELLDELDIQMQHFSDEKDVGRYLRDYVEYVRNHDFTDDDGQVRPGREALNEWLKLSQILGDRYSFPETHYVIQAIERALVEWDPSEQARTFVKDVEHARV